MEILSKEVRDAFEDGRQDALIEVAQQLIMAEKEGRLVVMPCKEDVVNARRESGWISVDERLPKIGSKVLVYESFRRSPLPETHPFAEVLNSTKGTMWALVFDKDGWYMDGFIFPGKYISHWMPLPEPPKEEEHE